LNGVRVSVLPVGADAAAVVATAASADRAGIDGFWFGGLGPASDTGSVDDAYVMTALCGAASRTRDIRLGALLDLAPERAALTSAEDIGVLDQASGGRLELGLVPSGGPGWPDRAALVLTSWTDWPVAGHDVVVTPRPAQPVVPRLVLATGTGDEAGIRRRLRAGVLMVGGRAARVADGERRVIVRRETVPEGKDLDSVGEYVRDLRDAVDAADADEAIIAAPAGDLLRERFVDFLAGVVAPVVRCPRAEAPVLLHDALSWWRRCG
jgi:alkanesulfonate monooxygenase SsuD/methylene tetrahydromethanopterin reductase-like flavin-dependent oxidoreductase (luciferase family)